MPRALILLSQDMDSHRPLGVTLASSSQDMVSLPPDTVSQDKQRPEDIQGKRRRLPEVTLVKHRRPMDNLLSKVTVLWVSFVNPDGF